MLTRPARIIAEIVMTATVIASMAVALVAWRLSSGPISLAFVTPIIERALDPGDGSYSVHIDDTVIQWNDRRTLPEFRVQGLHVLGPEGDLMAEAPAAAVRLSIRALLAGRLAPTRIDLIGPHITLERSADGVRLLHGAPGTAAPGGQTDRASMLALLLPELGGTGEVDGVLRDVGAVGVIGAAVTLEDRVTGRVWYAPTADIVIVRGRGALRARMSANVEVAGQSARIEGNATLDIEAGRVDLSIVLPRLDSAMIAMADPGLSQVGTLRAEIGGRIEMVVGVADGVRAANIDLYTGPGTLSDERLFPEPLQFAGLRLRARSEGSLDTVSFEATAIEIAGATLTASGRIEHAMSQPMLMLNAEARNVQADELRLLWPNGVGPGARQWVTANISEGIVEEGTLELVARMPEGSTPPVVVERLDARMRYSGLKINYRDPMTPVHGVGGTATFTAARAVFDVDSGSALGLRVDSGQIVISGLDEEDQAATIDLVIRGPTRDALQIIDGPPLGYIRRINKTPGDFGGNASARLQLRMPLIRTLTMDDVQVAAAGTATNFQLRHAALEQDVRGGTLNFRVDDRGIDLNGRVTLGTVLAEVELTRNFAPNAPFVMRTHARGRVSASDLATFRLDPRPWLEGTVVLDLVHTENRNRRDEVVIDATLDDSEMRIAALDWSKRRGVRGTARFEIGIAGDRASELRSFRLSTAGLEARGSGTFAPDGHALRVLRMDQLATGQTRVRAVATFEAQLISVEMSGAAFDLAPLLRDINRGGSGTMSRTDAPAIQIQAELDRVIIDPNRSIERVRFSGRRSGERWQSAELETGPRSDGAPQLRAVVRTESGGRRSLRVVSPDFGAVAAAFGISPNVRGGRLEITGATDENRESKPMVGRIEARDFRVVNAPVLARILGVALLTGIGDALRGDGISFSQLDGQFEFGGGRLTMRNWHAYGSSIGMTATGSLDLDAGVMAVDGVVVPAYAINGLVANIPVIGQIFAGGPGGGMFAANYRATGSLNDPRVSVNMLSALAPGFLRNLFRSTQGAGGTNPQTEIPQPMR